MKYFIGIHDWCLLYIRLRRINLVYSCSLTETIIIISILWNMQLLRFTIEITITVKFCANDVQHNSDSHQTELDSTMKSWNGSVFSKILKITWSVFSKILTITWPVFSKILNEHRRVRPWVRDVRCHLWVRKVWPVRKHYLCPDHVVCNVTFLLSHVTKESNNTGIILYMRPANERRRYIVMSSLFCWAHIQNDPWLQIVWWI